MARSRQLGFQFKTWGGARAGAGRPPKGEKAGVSHLLRPAHSWRHPLHVTLKVKQGIPSLREHALFVVVRGALAAARQQFGFSLVHFSVQRDHLHLLAEAADRRALSRGVQGLAIRVALAVNRQLHRKGRLFADRYHARALKTPREAGFALRYVLLNARKHAARAPQGSAGACARGAATPRSAGELNPKTRAPQGSAGACARGAATPRSAGELNPKTRAPQGSAGESARRGATASGAVGEVRSAGGASMSEGGLGVPWGWVDGCSSAAWFRDFVRPVELAFGARRCREEFARRHPSFEAPVVLPETWLLRSGYQRAGPFDVDDVPG